MYKRVVWDLKESGEKEIRISGANKDLMADRLLKAINCGCFPYKEVVQGLYEGRSCPHKLYIEKNKTGTHITYAGFMGYVLYEADTLRIIDVQDLYVGLTGGPADKVFTGNPDAPFDLVDAIKRDPRSQRDFKFKSSLTFDNETRQYEVIIDEIDATGFGDSKGEAIEITMDNVESLTEDFFQNLELYMQTEQYEKQYLYFDRIRGCKSREELKRMLNLQ